jgi:hypothetical protein
MHWGDDAALENHYVPTRSQRTKSVLLFFAQAGTSQILVYANADLSKATQAGEVLVFAHHWKTLTGHWPHRLVMDQKVTNQDVLAELDNRGITFLTLHIHGQATHRALRPPDERRTTPRRIHPVLPHRRPRRVRSPQRRPRRRPHHPRGAVCVALRRRLTGYHHATPDTLQRRFLSTTGTITTTGDTITVHLNRRTYSPLLRQADLPDTLIPWWGNRTVHFEYH